MFHGLSSATEKQFEAQHQIANNHLPDKPQDFTNLLPTPSALPPPVVSQVIAPQLPTIDTKSLDDSLRKLNKSIAKLQKMTKSIGSASNASTMDISGIWDCQFTTTDGYSASGRISYTLFGPGQYQVQYVGCISGDCEGIIETNTMQVSIAELQKAGITIQKNRLGFPRGGDCTREGSS
jgi:hypothetical protein